MSAELKPCPFCGGSAEADYCRGYRALGDGRLGNAAAIYCTECHADMTLCYRDVPDLDHDQAMISLAEAWNKRTPTHQPTEALMTIQKWLASYVWEAGAFGKYRDHVILDGVMTAEQAYALAKLFDVKAQAPGENRRIVSTKEQTPVQGAEPSTSEAHPEREAAGRTGSSNLPTGATPLSSEFERIDTGLLCRAFGVSADEAKRATDTIGFMYRQRA